MPEGSIAFANEPLLRVTAPFDEALLLESGLLQAINLATLIATKASRVVWAARGKPVAAGLAVVIALVLRLVWTLAELILALVLWWWGLKPQSPPVATGGPEGRE